VYINFQYTATSTTAKKSTLVNALMGYAPSFRADLYLPYNGKSLIITCNNCVANKLSMSDEAGRLHDPGVRLRRLRGRRGQRPDLCAERVSEYDSATNSVARSQETLMDLIACTGWTWEYIDNHMTVPRLSAMTRYWNQNPPVHVLVAGYIGYEAPKTAEDGKPPAAPSQDDIETLIASIPRVQR
jgi:hypothetical protein